MFQVVLNNTSQRKLKKIPEPYFSRIVIILKNLEINPLVGKKLEGRYKDDYSIRVWPYRIIYTIKKKELIIEVIEITHRGGAYRK